MKRLIVIGFVLAALAAACGQSPAPEPEEATQSASLPACDPDNGGITLPDGFCALVVADGLGCLRRSLLIGHLQLCGRDGHDRSRPPYT